MATETSINIEKLTAMGSEWLKGDMHRVYFNDLAGLYGLQCQYYNSGNISSATLDGDKISNSAAREIAESFRYVKVWFNVTTGEFESKGIKASAFNKIVSAIVAQASN